MGRRRAEEDEDEEVMSMKFQILWESKIWKHEKSDGVYELTPEVLAYIAM